MRKKRQDKRLWIIKDLFRYTSHNLQLFDINTSFPKDVHDETFPKDVHDLTFPKDEQDLTVPKDVQI